jgi:hypothetical protein
VGNFDVGGSGFLANAVHPHMRGELTSWNLLFLKVFHNTQFFTGICHAFLPFFI